MKKYFTFYKLLLILSFCLIILSILILLSSPISLVLYIQVKYDGECMR